MVETIADLFYASIQRDLPVALAFRVDGAFVPISHRELAARVERLALALAGRGLGRGDRLAILAENRPEWAITDYACALSGIVSVPIYPALGLAQTAHILKTSRPRWAVCSTPAQLAKLLSLWEGLPDLEAVVLMAGSPPALPGRPVLAWDELQAEGAAQEGRRSEVRDRAGAVKPADPLTIIFTSGTTGDPKGAVLSHGNVVADILATLRIIQPAPGEKMLSILPLFHIFERTCGNYIMLFSGVGIHYAESFQTIPRDLLEVRPDILIGVPRVFEKGYARVRETVAAAGPLSRLVFRCALRVGRRVAPCRYEGRRPGWWLRLALRVFDPLVFRKVRAAFGGRVRLAASGGAPLHPGILEFFWAAGIPVFEGYGLTETSPIIAVSAPGEVRPGYVGRPILDTWQGKPFLALAEDGEILCRGPNVMLGYWDGAAGLQEAVDGQGYFHTGDVGELDARGRLKITDRKKEILITSGGKNVPPQPLENALRGDEFIEQAVVIGDRRKFIAALLVPDFAELRRWARLRGLRFDSDAGLVALPEVMDEVMRRVARINAGFSNYEAIKKVILLDRELTAESGLLTPSLKVRRRVVDQVFAARIDELYGGPVAEGLAGAGTRSPG